MALVGPTAFLLRKLHNGQDANVATRDELRYFRPYYGQFGEDVVLANLCEERCLGPECIYIDCGAHHPSHISNTLLLHKLGWYGINIDLSPEKIRLFNRDRPKDDNVCAAVSDRTGEVTVAYYGFSVTNRIVDGGSMRSLGGETPDSLHQIRSRTLGEIWRESKLYGRPVGVLNVDCEGHDLQVLAGADLREMCPSVIAVEAFGREGRRAVRDFMRAYPYEYEGRLRQTMFFASPMND